MEKSRFIAATTEITGEKSAINRQFFTDFENMGRNERKERKLLAERKHKPLLFHQNLPLFHIKESEIVS